MSDSTIDAVATVIHDTWTDDHSHRGAHHTTRALAEAGRLKAPADEILTAADRAVLDAAEAARDGHGWQLLDLWDAVDARRVAAGGTAPTDPSIDCNCGFGGFHDEINSRCALNAAPTDPKEAKP